MFQENADASAVVAIELWSSIRIDGQDGSA